MRIFIYSDMQSRIARITEKNLYEPKDVVKNIKRIDKERRDYHRYYTGREWEALENYDLIINTGTIGVDGAVQVIQDYLKVSGQA